MELVDLPATGGAHDTLADAPVQVAHQLRVGLGQLSERALQEEERGIVGAVVVERRIEAEPAHLTDERAHTARPALTGACLARPQHGCSPVRPTGRGRVVGVGAGSFGECGEQPADELVGLGLEAGRRGIGGECVEVLRAPDGAAVHGLALDETRVAHALEVEANRVGMQADPGAEIGGAHRLRAASQLPVQRRARIVAERSQQVHHIHPGIDGTLPMGIFSRSNRVLFSMDERTASQLPSAPHPPPTVEAVHGALGGVLDPELGLSVEELGMVRRVEIDGDGTVRVGIALTTAACPLRGQIGADARTRIESLPGVREVLIDYAEMTREQRADLMGRARKEAQRRAPATRVPATTRVLAVASGKGGVGKSSVTVNLAVALAARGFTVGVLDADIWGFSIPRLLGVASRLQARKVDGKGLIQPEQLPVGDAGGRLRVVSMGLLLDDEDSALMWRGLILSKALEQFLTDVEWGDLDYLMIDMPPGTGDIQMALARLLPQAELLVVTTPAANAQKVASRVADMARRSHLMVLGVVENMTAFVAPDGSRHEIFGHGGGRRLAALTGAPLLTQVPIEPAVSTTGDEGRPVVTAHPEAPAAAAFTELAQRIAEELLPPIEMAGCTARMADLLAGIGAPTTEA